MSFTVAADPGKATGLAFQMSEGDTPFTETVTDFRQVPRRITRFHKPDIIHAEEFRISSATAKHTAAPWSLKLYGALEVMCFETGIHFSHAAAGQAKSLVSDAMLKKAGVYKDKSAHERDALRHLVLCGARRQDPWCVAVLRGSV